MVLSCFQVAVPVYTDFSQQEKEFSPYFHCSEKVTLFISDNVHVRVEKVKSIVTSFLKHYVLKYKGFGFSTRTPAATGECRSSDWALQAWPTPGTAERWGEGRAAVSGARCGPHVFSGQNTVHSYKIICNNFVSAPETCFHTFTCSPIIPSSHLPLRLV